MMTFNKKAILISLATIIVLIGLGLANEVKAAPDPPSSLGPLNYTDGSWGSDNTPTLQFTQTDTVATHTIKFTIQISTTSDYSLPKVDYTSGLIATGTASFTVGQATSADNGTYTVGQEGQTLNGGSYYWRVMSTCIDDATSTWTTATGTGVIAFRIDTSAPTSVSVTSITESTATDYQYASGTNIVYYNTATSSGSFIANATATDAESGIQKINFPDTVSAGGDDTSDPYALTYTWDSSDTFSQSANITAYNNAGVTTTAAFYVYLDTSAPSGGSITYTDGYYTATSVSITVSDGTDSDSGVDTSSRTLQRKEADLSGGSCGSYGSFATVSPSGSYPDLTDITVVSGKCYQYRYLVSDNVSNQATNTSANTAKIDTSAPTSVSIVSITADSTSQLTVTATATAADSGLHATPFWFAETSNNPGSSSSTDWQVSANFVDAGLATNTQYIYKVKARDAAGNESSYSATSSKYTLAPTPTNLTGTAGETTMTLAVDSFTNNTADSSGYYFWRTGNNSGWIQTNSWQDTGLSCGNSYTFYVKYRNGDGTETDSASLTASTLSCPGRSMPFAWRMPPKTPEGGFQVLINTGAKYTNSQKVTLDLTGGPDTSRMAISNASDFQYAGQEPYSQSKEWDLCKGKSTCPEGKYTVYVKFYAPWGTASKVVSDSIIKAVIPEAEGAEIAACEGISFDRHLQQGMSGDDVKCMQAILNLSSDTQVAASGIGSAENETTYFGPLTKAAVVKFQEKYTSDVLAPWALTSGTGYVGDTTIDKLNELKSAVVSEEEEAEEEMVPEEPEKEVSEIPPDFTFENNLSSGMSGNEVKYLQIFLNSNPETKLAESGVGSPGNETEYFGPLTKAAVVRFQEKYTSDVLAPWALTSGTGYVSSTTRAKINEILGR